jgi:hypothetical protein
MPQRIDGALWKRPGHADRVAARNVAITFNKENKKTKKQTKEITMLPSKGTKIKTHTQGETKEN